MELIGATVNVLFVSSEIYPLAKTGGLADVSAALPKALATLGVDIRPVLPGYPSALRVAAEQRLETKLDNVPDAAPNASHLCPLA